MTSVTVLVNFGLLFLIVFGMIESGHTATQRLAESTGKTKGDLGDINEPVSSPPKWDTVNADSNRNKGDLGVIDPRGTVRWNIMADGRIAKGVPTSIGDNDWPIQHAKGQQ